MASKEDGRQHSGEMNDDESHSAAPLDAEERLDTERVLGAFAPRAPRLQRDRLLALVQGVNQPAVQLRTPWYWPAATAVMTATSLALAVLLAVRVPAESSVRVEYRDRIVYREPIVERPSQMITRIPKTTQPIATERPRDPQEYATHALRDAARSGAGVAAHPEENYFRDRRLAIEHGIDAIATSRPVVNSGRLSPPATQRELMRQFVPLAALHPAMSSINRIGWSTHQ